MLGTSAVNAIVPKNFAYCNNQEGLPGESDLLAFPLISMAAVTNHSEASWKWPFWLADGTMRMFTVTDTSLVTTLQPISFVQIVLYNGESAVKNDFSKL